MTRHARTTRRLVSVSILLAAISNLPAARAGDYWEPKNFAPVTDPAKKRQIHADSAAIWREGNEFYEAGDYKKSLEIFERSIVKYQILHLTDDIAKVERAIQASACMDRRNSTGVNQLKELISEDEQMTPGRAPPTVCPSPRGGRFFSGPRRATAQLWPFILRGSRHDAAHRATRASG